MWIPDKFRVTTLYFGRVPLCYQVLPAFCVHSRNNRPLPQVRKVWKTNYGHRLLYHSPHQERNKKNPIRITRLPGTPYRIHCLKKMLKWKVRASPPFPPWTPPLHFCFNKTLRTTFSQEFKQTHNLPVYVQFSAGICKMQLQWPQ